MPTSKSSDPKSIPVAKPAPSAVKTAAPKVTAKAKPIVAPKTVTPAPINITAPVPATPVVLATEKLVAEAVVEMKPAAEIVAAQVPVAAKPVEPAPVVAAPMAKAPVVAVPVVPAPVVAAAVAAKVIPTSTPIPTVRMVDVPKVVKAVSKVATEAAPPLNALPSLKGYGDMAAFGKANFEALVEANAVFAKGMEEISKELFDHSFTAFESAAATATAMFGIKTLQDAVELNTKFTKAQYEKLVAATTKLGELTAKVATESAGPLKARATEVIETVAHPVA